MSVVGPFQTLFYSIYSTLLFCSEGGWPVEQIAETGCKVSTHWDVQNPIKHGPEKLFCSGLGRKAEQNCLQRHLPNSVSLPFCASVGHTELLGWGLAADFFYQVWSNLKTDFLRNGREQCCPSTPSSLALGSCGFLMLDESLWPSAGTDPLIFREGDEGFFCTVMTGVEISMFVVVVCFSELCTWH